jgi:hypothetical protein
MSFNSNFIHRLETRKAQPIPLPEYLVTAPLAQVKIDKP